MKTNIEPQRVVDRLPMPHRLHAQQVLQAIGELQSQFAALPEEPSGDVPGVDSHAVVSICGDRGTGKTTILEAVRSELRSGTNVVLPTIRPEMFSTADSVLGLAIANLQRELARSRPELLTREMHAGTEVTLGTFLNRLLSRASVIAGRDSVDERSFRSLDAAADDFVRSASIGSAFIEQWCELVTFVCWNLASETEGTDTVATIIIPVDDADLAPELLQRILVDMRIMTTAAHVVCLAGIDLDEAALALGEHYLRGYPSLKAFEAADSSTVVRMNRVVESQLSKAIPPQWRNTIRGLTLTERLDFTPLGSHDTRSIAELLKSFPLPLNAATADPLSYLFYLPRGASEPSPYAQCLPSSPRELSALHAQLKWILERENTDGSTSRLAARILIEYGMNFGIRNSGSLSLRADEFVSFDDTVDSNSIYLDFTKVNVYGQSMHDFVRIPTHGLEVGSEIEVGKPSRNVSRYGPRDARFEDKPRLHVAVLHSLLLSRELSIVHPLFREDATGGAPIKGRATTQALTMILGKETTDGNFLNYPSWDGYYDYYLVDHAWDLVLQKLRGGPTRAADHRTTVAAVTLEWWRIITAVQLQRTIPTDLGSFLDLLSQRRANSSELLRNAWRSVWDGIREAYLGELNSVLTKPEDIRAHDFTDWVEARFLNFYYPPLQHPWFIELTLEARSALLKQVDRLSLGNAFFASLLTTRLRRVTDEEWIGPLIEVLSRFDPQAGSEIHRLHQAARSNRERRSASLTGAVTLSGTTEAPAVVDSDSLFRTAMGALQELEAEADLDEPS